MKLKNSDTCVTRIMERTLRSGQPKRTLHHGLYEAKPPQRRGGHCGDTPTPERLAKGMARLKQIDAQGKEVRERSPSFFIFTLILS